MGTDAALLRGGEKRQKTSHSGLNSATLDEEVCRTKEEEAVKRETEHDIRQSSSDGAGQSHEPLKPEACQLQPAPRTEAHRNVLEHCSKLDQEVLGPSLFLPGLGTYLPSRSATSSRCFKSSHSVPALLANSQQTDELATDGVSTPPSPNQLPDSAWASRREEDEHSECFSPAGSGMHTPTSPVAMLCPAGQAPKRFRLSQPDIRDAADETRPWPFCGRGHTKEQSETLGHTVQVAVDVWDKFGPCGKGLQPGIATGLRQLDLMVEQLIAYAQLDVSLKTLIDGEQMQGQDNRKFQPGLNEQLCQTVGLVLGKAITEMLRYSSIESGKEDRDTEKLVEKPCKEEVRDELQVPLQELQKHWSNPPDSQELCRVHGNCCRAPSYEALCEVILHPELPDHEHYPSHCGRLADQFLRYLSEGLGCSITLRKLRGEKPSDIVEATIKASARCLRQAIDTLCSFNCSDYATCTGYMSSEVHELHEPAFRAGFQCHATEEADIEVSVELMLHEPSDPACISTGVAKFDLLVREFQDSSGFRVMVKCLNLQVRSDSQMIVKEVMIALGRVLAEAIGDRELCCGYGCADGFCGKAKVRCILEFADVPRFCSDLRLTTKSEEIVGDISLAAVLDCLKGFALHSLITVHLVQLGSSTWKNRMASAGNAPSAEELAMAAMCALGKALKRCVAIDPRHAFATNVSNDILLI